MPQSRRMADPVEIRAQIARIGRSASFRNSDRIRRFLEYTVEMTLRGEQEHIKEFVLGREVFDRGEDYDPRLDPIVRVEARRLRQRLADYYAGPGKEEPLRIEYPKGSYVPVIRAKGAARPRRRTLAAAGALAVLAVGAWLVTRYVQAPAALAVVPAHWAWPEPGAFGDQEERLAEAATAELVNAGRRAVIGWPVVAGRRQAFGDFRGAAAGIGARDVAVVSVRQESEHVRVTVFLLEAATGRKRWVRDFGSGTSPQSLSPQSLAAEVAAALPDAGGR